MLLKNKITFSPTFASNLLISTRKFLSTGKPHTKVQTGYEGLNLVSP